MFLISHYSHYSISIIQSIYWFQRMEKNDLKKKKGLAQVYLVWGFFCPT